MFFIIPVQLMKTAVYNSRIVVINVNVSYMYLKIKKMEVQTIDGNCIAVPLTFIYR